MDDPGIYKSDANDLVCSSLEQVDNAAEDMFDWNLPLFRGVFDDLNFHVDDLMIQPVFELAPLPPSDFLLSLLLNEKGFPLFVANAKEIAASVGLHLGGLLWALVHHKDCDSDQEEVYMDHWVVVAHSEAFLTDFCGRSFASLLSADTKDRSHIARLFLQVLFGAVTKCSVATVLMNAVVIRGNGEKVDIRNTFIFYDQVSEFSLLVCLFLSKILQNGRGRFQFFVLGNRPLRVVGSSLSIQGIPEIKSSLKY